MNGSPWGAAAWVVCALLFFPPGHLDAQAPEAPAPAEPSSPDTQTQQPVASDPTERVTPPRIETGDLVQAIIESRRTLQLQPNSIETRSRLALLLYQLGDVDGSIEEYRAILAFNYDFEHAPDLAQVHVDLASALMAKQEWRAAQTELTEALRIRPELVQAHTSLGAVRYALGDVTGAIHAYEEALKLRPEFADAHYHLGLLLKVTGREAEAARAFHAAAEAGLPKAQYFLGTAYVHGLGVERDPPTGLAWWLRAAEQGLAEAGEALAQWRQVALGKARRPPAENQAAMLALLELRRRMWREFPGLGAPTTEEGPGAALLAQGRLAEAVPALVREAAALSEPAQLTLERLYDQGVEGQLARYDPRILRYFTRAAAEGLPRPKLALARIYAGGLGVPKDHARALALLREHPDEEGHGSPRHAP